MTTESTARDLVEELRRELAPGEVENRFVPLVAAGRAPRERLAAFACEELDIIPSDRRSFAFLAARFPESPAGDLFLGLADGEGLALRHLRAFSDALGLDARAVATHEPHPGCRAYAAYVAWLALNGSRSDVAVAFFDFFATPPPGLEDHAVAVVRAGLDAGDEPQHARRAARLLQAYELQFWNSLAEGLE